MTTETLNTTNESEIRTLSVDEISATDGGFCWSCYIVPPYIITPIFM